MRLVTSLTTRKWDNYINLIRKEITMYIPVCKIDNKYVQQMLLDNGFTIDGEKEIAYEDEDGCLILYLDDMEATHFATDQGKGDELNFEQLVHLLEDLEDKIVIDENVVCFTDDGINVGCVQIDMDTVTKIYKKAKENYEN